MGLTITREDAEAALAARGYTFDPTTAEYVKGDVRGRLSSNPARTSWFLRLPGTRGFLRVAGAAPFGHDCPDA